MYPAGAATRVPFQATLDRFADGWRAYDATLHHPPAGLERAYRLSANVVKATLTALLSLRLREDIYRGRGIEIKKVPSPKPPTAMPEEPPQAMLPAS